MTVEKGKVIPESSNSKKRLRKATQVEDGEEEESEKSGSEGEGDVDGLPVWKKKTRLTQYDISVQSKMYIKHVESSKTPLTGMLITERQVSNKDFGRFGVTECFERLGWEECLRFDNNNDKLVHTQAIFDWMSTLRKEAGRNPPVTTKLIGRVNNKNIELSFSTFRQLGKFDSGGTTGLKYEYPTDAELSAEKPDENTWITMISELFDVPPGTNIIKWKLERANLKAKARLLLGFVNSNVMPRQGDMGKVRYNEIMVLYALMTGAPMLSVRHLIMYNIWEARDKEEKKMVPHARLLSKLIKKFGGVAKGVLPYKAEYRPWKLSTIVRSSDWRYEKTRTKHRLYMESSGKSVEAQRSDIEDEVESDEEMGDIGAGADQFQVRDPVVIGFSPSQFDMPYYKYLQHEMVKARPDGFGLWGDGIQAIFDRQSQEFAANKVFREAMMWRQEEMRNEDFLRDEAIRHERDYERGFGYSLRPRPVDWQDPSLKPYAETNKLPRYVQSSPSKWVDPYSQQQQDQGSSSSSSGAFDMKIVGHSLFERVFGAPYQPPPYDG